MGRLPFVEKPSIAVTTVELSIEMNGHEDSCPQLISPDDGKLEGFLCLKGDKDISEKRIMALKGLQI